MESSWTHPSITEDSPTPRLRFPDTSTGRDHSRYPSRSRRDRLGKNGIRKDSRLPASNNPDPLKSTRLSWDACPSTRSHERVGCADRVDATGSCSRNKSKRICGIWWRKPSGTASSPAGKDRYYRRYAGTIIGPYSQGDHRPQGPRCASSRRGGPNVGHGLLTRCQADHQHPTQKTPNTPFLGNNP